MSTATPPPTARPQSPGEEIANTISHAVGLVALLGIVLNATGAMRYRRFSTGVYLGMGWLMLIAIRPLWLRLPLPGVLWLLAGGLAYTVGVAFFSAKRIPYSHLIWHLFVLVGTSCHFIAVLLYAA